MSIPPARNTDGSTPVNLLGYNVYRTLASQPEAEPKPLNPEPVTGTKYPDKKFKFSEKYVYFVRSVSLGTEGKQVESLDSNTIALSQADNYKPAAPESLQAQGAPGRIAL